MNNYTIRKAVNIHFFVQTAIYSPSGRTWMGTEGIWAAEFRNRKATICRFTECDRVSGMEWRAIQGPNVFSWECECFSSVEKRETDVFLTKNGCGLWRSSATRDNVAVLPRATWDSIMECGLAFSAHACTLYDNYIDKAWAAQFGAGSQWYGFIGFLELKI